MRDESPKAHLEDTSNLPQLFPETATTTGKRSAGVTHTQNNDRPSGRTMTLYAIIDTATNEITGGIQLHLTPASALRTLADIATGNTMLNKHPRDYNLYSLGTLTRDHDIVPDKTIIITGQQIEAMIDAHEEAAMAKATNSNKA